MARRRLGKPSHPRKAVLPRAKTPAKPVSGSCPYYTTILEPTGTFRGSATAECRSLFDRQAKLQDVHTLCEHCTIKASRPSACYQNGKRNASAKTANAVFTTICVYYTIMSEPTGTFRGSATAECRSLFDRQAKLQDVRTLCEHCTIKSKRTGMFRGLALPNTGHTFRPVSETPPIIEDDCFIEDDCMFTLCMNIVPQILNEPGSFTVWLCQTPAVPSGR